MSTIGQIKEIAVKHGKEMAAEMILAALYPALEKVVADSPNKYDDIILASFGEKLKEEILKLIQEA